MTTLAIILKAKKEIERAIEGKSNVISKALDTQEYQASQMGKALALLEVAEDQLREDYTWKGRPQSKMLPQNKSEQDMTETKAAEQLETGDKNLDAPQEAVREPTKENCPAGAKGLMLLQCPACKRTFKAFMKEPTEEIECEKCGRKIKLDVLARFEYTAPPVALTDMAERT